MGQTQAVTAVRYITRDSVEQVSHPSGVGRSRSPDPMAKTQVKTIAMRQQHKRRIARVSLDSHCSGDNEGERLEVDTTVSDQVHREFPRLTVIRISNSS